MNYRHKNLACGRWKEIPFVEQMANIGSEVERALNWRAKNNVIYSQEALERSLELIDLTLESAKAFPRLKELCRVRELLLDYFLGINEYGSSDAAFKRYFLHFAFAARKNF